MSHGSFNHMGIKNKINICRVQNICQMLFPYHKNVFILKQTLLPLLGQINFFN